MASAQKQSGAAQIQPEERWLLVLLSVIFVSFKIGLEIAGNLAEVLYFHRVGVEKLPRLYAAEPLAMIAVLFAFGLVLERINRCRLLLIMNLLFAATLIAARPLMLSGWQPFYFLQYINQRIFFLLTQLVFWLVCSDLFDIRQARRLFVLITAIGLVGVLLGNLLTGVFSSLLRPEALLPLLSLFFLFSAGLLAWLERRRLPTSVARAGVENDKRYSPALPFDLLRQPFIRMLVVLILITGALEPVWRYELNFIAEADIAGEANLIAFYGYFKGAAVLVTILFQIFIAGRLMQKMGVLWSLSSHPLGLVGIMLLIAVFPHLPMAIAAVALIGIIRVGFDESGRKTIISIYPPYERGRLSTFERQGNYLGIFLGSLLMMWAVEHLSLSQINWLAAGTAGLWLLALPGLRQKYAQVCLQGGALRLDEAGPLPQTSGEAGARLLSWVEQIPDGGERLAAAVQAAGLRDPRVEHLIAEELAGCEEPVALAQLQQALRAPNWDVRQYARRALVERGKLDDLLEAQVKHFERGAALLALPETCKLGRETQRAAAEAILLLLGSDTGQDPIRMAGRMLRSPAPEQRANGLEAMENLLNRADKARLLALFESAFAAPDESPRAGEQALSPALRHQRYADMVESGDPHLAFWGQVLRLRAGKDRSPGEGPPYLLPKFSVNADRAEAPLLLAGVRFPPNGEKAMQLADTIDALRDTDIFGNLAEVELHAVALCTRSARYPAEAVIFEEGQPGGTMYVLLKGQVELACVAEKKSLQVLCAGQAFGEQALFTGAPYTLTAVAISAVEVFLLERQALLELVNYYPNIALGLLQNMARRYEATTALLQRVWV